MNILAEKVYFETVLTTRGFPILSKSYTGVGIFKQNPLDLNYNNNDIINNRQVSIS